MNFYDWLVSYIDEDTPRGDLARDVIVDRNFPREATSLAECKRYLEDNNVEDRIIHILTNTWKQYRQGVTTVVNVKDTRINKGLSQMDLARIASVSLSTISRLENGHPVGVIQARKICDALGLELSQIQTDNLLRGRSA